MTEEEKKHRDELRVSPSELLEAWPLLADYERLEGLRSLTPKQSSDYFRGLSSLEQSQIISRMPPRSRKVWLQMLPPDDLADTIQQLQQNQRPHLLALLDDSVRTEVNALLAYGEDVAGGLMTPRYDRVRSEMTVGEAIAYLRKQAREHITSLSYAYVLDTEQHLLGVVSFQDLFASPDSTPVTEITKTDMVTVPDSMDQEGVSRIFSQNSFSAIPVVDDQNRMKGIVTADDIVAVVQEEATEDIQKGAAVEILSAPYLKVGLWEMVRKRGTWLSALFFGEMLTATAMAYFQNEIAKAVVLALFIPLIISSGGNSGSQASTLIIRAMALGEVTLKDWWRVVRRELLAGLSLGTVLGTIGFFRIFFWPTRLSLYGAHYIIVGFTVACSLVGVVCFGTLAGSMLPFLLRKCRLDPASASAPFVATMVDVTGLIIYFTIAQIFLKGILL